MVKNLSCRGSGSHCGRRHDGQRRIHHGRYAYL